MATINDYLIRYLGLSMVFLPFVFISSGLVMFQTKWKWSKPNVLLGALLIMLGVMGGFRTGEIGEQTFTNLSRLLSVAGSYVFFFALIIVGLLVIFQTSIGEFLELMSKINLPSFGKNKDRDEFGDEEEKSGGFHLPKLNLSFKKPALALGKNNDVVEEEGATAVDPMFIPKLPLHNDNLLDSSTITTAPVQRIWEYPPLSLLANSSGGEADRGDVKLNAQIIENTLNSFGIKAQVAEKNYGPSVTQYALRSNEGTKLSKITALSTDLAMALGTPTGQVRIEAPLRVNHWVALKCQITPLNMSP